MREKHKQTKNFEGGRKKKKENSSRMGGTEKINEIRRLDRSHLRA